MKRAMGILVLIAMLVLVGLPFSVVDQCYRPQDVRSTERFYDQATGTYIQFVPTSRACSPLNYPNEPGIEYVRLQWRAQ